MVHIESNKFSDTSIIVRTMLPLESATISAYNILVAMMKNKTKRFPSKQALVSFLNHAYGIKIAFSLTSYGNQIAITLRMQYIRQDYIEDPEYIKQVITALDEILFHSLLDEANFEEAKYALGVRLRRIQDDPDSLAIYEVFQNTCCDHSIRIPVQGRMSDLEGLTLPLVYDVYDRYIKADKHVFVCGHLQEDMKAYLERISSKNELEVDYTILKDAKKNQKIFSKAIAQSSIAQIYATNTDIRSKDYYPMLVTNAILGQSPSSLLFDEVREKHSLCYSIQSSLIRFDGAMLIYLGVKKENIDKALELISLQIERIKNLDFDEGLLDVAKKDCIDGLIVGQDQAFSMIEQSFLDHLLKRDDMIEDKIKQIENVSLEDVSRAAKKLECITNVIVEDVCHEI